MADYGMYRSDGMSDHLKVYIRQGDVTVVGYIGDGAAKSLTSQWQNPFEEDTVGQAAGGNTNKAADLLQVETRNTSKTVLNTAMVWQGIGPHEVQLPVFFKAFANAKREVNDAIMYLEMFASPELANKAGVGAIPQVCSVNIGRRLILPNCQITDVSSELDAPRDANGYMTRNTVQLSITMDRMTNRSSVQNLYQ